MMQARQCLAESRRREYRLHGHPCPRSRRKRPSCNEAFTGIDALFHYKRCNNVPRPHAIIDLSTGHLEYGGSRTSGPKSGLSAAYQLRASGPSCAYQGQLINFDSGHRDRCLSGQAPFRAPDRQGITCVRAPDVFSGRVDAAKPHRFIVDDLHLPARAQPTRGTQARRMLRSSTRWPRPTTPLPPADHQNCRHRSLT